MQDWTHNRQRQYHCRGILQANYVSLRVDCEVVYNEVPCFNGGMFTTSPSTLRCSKSRVLQANTPPTHASMPPNHATWLTQRSVQVDLWVRRSWKVQRLRLAIWLEYHFFCFQWWNCVWSQREILVESTWNTKEVMMVDTLVSFRWRVGGWV